MSSCGCNSGQLNDRFSSYGEDANHVVSLKTLEVVNFHLMKSWRQDLASSSHVATWESFVNSLQPICLKAILCPEQQYQNDKNGKTWMWDSWACLLKSWLTGQHFFPPSIVQDLVWRKWLHSEGGFARPHHLHLCLPHFAGGIQRELAFHSAKQASCKWKSSPFWETCPSCMASGRYHSC